MKKYFISEGNLVNGSLQGFTQWHVRLEYGSLLSVFRLRLNERNENHIEHDQKTEVQLTNNYNVLINNNCPSGEN